MAYHIDDLSEGFIRGELIPCINETSPTSSTCLYVFLSPQALVDRSYLREALLACWRRRVVRLVVIDEAHLYAMHGRTFREPIRILRRVCFDVVFASGAWHPLFLAMSATMTESLVSSLSELTNVDWAAKTNDDWRERDADHQLWSGPAQL